VQRRHELNWYAEEMFTRFQVLGVTGINDGSPVSV